MVELEQGLEWPEVGFLLPSGMCIGPAGPLHQVEGDLVCVIAAASINDSVREDVFGLLSELGLHHWWPPVRAMSR